MCECRQFRLNTGRWPPPHLIPAEFGKQIDAQLQASQNKLSEKAAAELDHAKVESRRLLRLQVQDFLKWLQAQGAI